MILCTNQFGFLNNSNTSDAIIEFLDYVYSSLDTKQSNIAVYLDFWKAFDTINHDILMSKLLHNGIRGVMQSCYKSNFPNRKQYVSIKNCSSSMSNIPLGVPQGCALGPVIFLLYINDMYRSSNQINVVHFADDTTEFASNSDINNVVASVNRELYELITGSRPTNFLSALVKLHIGLSPALVKLHILLSPTRKNALYIEVQD